MREKGKRDMNVHSSHDPTYQSLFRIWYADFIQAHHPMQPSEKQEKQQIGGHEDHEFSKSYAALLTASGFTIEMLAMHPGSMKFVCVSILLNKIRTTPLMILF